MELIHTLYQPSGQGPFPTLLTIHGRGANAFDLLGLAPHFCSGRFMVICPQAPLETPIGPETVGYAWYPMSMGGPPDIDAILTSRQRLQAFLEECLKTYSIDPRRLGIIGFSQGGVMAYSLALTNPERFAALAVLSSWLPKEMLPRIEISTAVQSLPTIVQHGTEDPTIPVDRAQKSVEILRQSKVPLTYREYQMGHEISARSLADLSGWLEEKFLSGG
ncbi:MAG TPA: prolyl oligopeptidase family serine peptidase [Candidatus Binatia bacterium]